MAFDQEAEALLVGERAETSLEAVHRFPQPLRRVLSPRRSYQRGAVGFGSFATGGSREELFVGYAEPMQTISPPPNDYPRICPDSCCRLPNHCGFSTTLCGRVIAPRSSQQWWIRRRSRTGPRRHTSVVRVSPAVLTVTARDACALLSRQLPVAVGQAIQRRVPFYSVSSVARAARRTDLRVAES